jgi:hypothetical protein
MTLNEENHNADQNENQRETYESENDVEELEEVPRGRDRRKFVVGFIFIFLVVVVWYVIDLLVGT